MSVECEKCGCELTYLEIDMFDREGWDDFIEVPIEEHENGVFADVTLNWCGYELDDDDTDKRDCIRCPYCHQYPFKDEEIQTYEFERIVMFFGERHGSDPDWEE